MTDSSKLMIPHGDGWASVPPEPERFTKGRVIKFRDGAYFINRNEPILADELKLLVIGVTVAWVRLGGRHAGRASHHPAASTASRTGGTEPPR
jgi:hypothetical protein